MIFQLAQAIKTPGAQSVIDKIKASEEFRYGVFILKNDVIDIESTGIQIIDSGQSGKKFLVFNNFFIHLFCITIHVHFPLGSRTETYDNYLAKLKVSNEECRYGLYDLEFQCKSSPVMSKILPIVLQH